MATFLSGDITPKAGPGPVYPNDSLGAAAGLLILPAACQERDTLDEASRTSLPRLRLKTPTRGIKI